MVFLLTIMFLYCVLNSEQPGVVTARFGEDIIIGNLDTGVWPESESFNDQSGKATHMFLIFGLCVKCQMNVVMIRKLIGARCFNKGVEAELGNSLNSSYRTVRDTSGHGTHTLSTAGGRFVGGANLSGSGYGTGKGGSPSARILRLFLGQHRNWILSCCPEWNCCCLTHAWKC
ncbi:unnamed protein product, partial [Vitis vinifera]